MYTCENKISCKIYCFKKTLNFGQKVALNITYLNCTFFKLKALCGFGI